MAATLGDVCLALTWGRICARFKIKRALVAVSLASMLSAGICFLYAVLPLPGVTVLFVLSSIAAVIVPLAFSGTADSTEQTAPERAEGRTTGATLASLADVVVAPGLGPLVFAFAMAVMRTAFNESQNAYLAALALDAATLLAYTTLRKKRFALRGGMHQTFLPLMAMVLLAATSISASVGSGSGLVSFLTYALYALAAILTLATLCAIANAGEFSADLVFSTAVLLFCAASFAGQSFASVLDDDLVHVAVTVTTTLYAFVMVLSSYMRRTRDAHDEQRAAEHAEDEEFREVKWGLIQDTPFHWAIFLGPETPEDVWVKRCGCLCYNWELFDEVFDPVFRSLPHDLAKLPPAWRPQIVYQWDMSVTALGVVTVRATVDGVQISSDVTGDSVTLPPGFQMGIGRILAGLAQGAPLRDVRFLESRGFSIGPTSLTGRETPELLQQIAWMEEHNWAPASLSAKSMVISAMRRL